MDSRGSVNGSEINALPINEGTFLVDCAAVVNVSTAPSLKLTRRIVSAAMAVVAVPGALLLTARRSAASIMTVAVLPSAKLVRRVMPRMASQVSVTATSKLVRRVAPIGSTNIRLNAGALLSWRFIHRTDQNRIMRAERPRHSLVQPEVRRMSVPAARNQMMVPRGVGVMP